jgi:hypothetical protein
MKNLKLILIFFAILFLNSCGYKKLNSENLNDFKIDKLEISGEKKLAYKLKNNIEIYSSQSSKFIYDVKIDLISTKETKIKNTSGKATRYTNKFQANALITNKKTQNVFKKTFSATNDYDVGSTHSDTLNNEKNSVENNINYISNEIVKYLKLLNI